MAILTLASALAPAQDKPRPRKPKQTQSSSQLPPKTTAINRQLGDCTTFQSETQKKEPFEVRVLSTPDKDLYDKAAVGLNFLLFLVGIGGIAVAAFTLRKIERQTKATEDAAEAALAQVRLIKSKERARVEVKAGGIEVQGEEGTVGWWLVGDVALGNIGQSTAYIVRSGGDILILGSNQGDPHPVDDCSYPVLDMPYKAVKPSSEFFRAAFWSGGIQPSLSDFAQSIVQAETQLLIRGFVEYETFGSVWHRDFAYIWISDGPREREAKLSRLPDMAAPNPIELIQDGYWAEDPDQKNDEFEITPS